MTEKIVTCILCASMSDNHDGAFAKTCAGCRRSICHECIARDAANHDLVETACCKRLVCQFDGCDDQNCETCDAELCVACLSSNCQYEGGRCVHLVCARCVVACHLCENRVCDEHFDFDEDMCADCACAEIDDDRDSTTATTAE